MLSTEYRFVCSSCNYELMSGMGIDRGPHYSKAAMVCETCAVVDTFSILNPGAISDPPPGNTVCKVCHSAKHLILWDGITCPHCKMKMKALGPNTKAVRSSKYW